MSRRKKAGEAETPKEKKDQPKQVHISELKIKSEATGNLITEGDANDPDLHDGQAWREGRGITGE